MQHARQNRPTDAAPHVSRELLAVVRILIASFFLATATGLVVEPSSRNFFDAVLPDGLAQAASTAFLFGTAFAIMVGKFVRPAALLLTVYLFWSAFLNIRLAADPMALSAFWRDMALLGAVLLIALTEPGGSSRLRLWNKLIVPRRITPTGEIESQNHFRHKPADEPRDVNADLTDTLIVRLPDLTGNLDNATPAEVHNIFANLADRRAESAGGG